ncbi:OmpA/MotB family protein [Rubrivirga sp.]|uniref:OmpA/MotB family protein n=1 Tax=Rubrivirga sp. TaxID=1885344 RepID=UPI003B52E71D
MAESPLAAFAEEEEPSSPFWMATFSDMMTLLLTFFVMLVAMSTVEVKKFEEAMSYFTGKRGVMSEPGVMPGVMGIVGKQDVREQAREFEEIAREVQARGLAEAVDVDLTERGVRVTFVDSVAFAPGSVALESPAREVLRDVAAMATAAAAVEVEGHTDDVPISTSAYPSNWELSAARAAAVVRFLLDQPGALAPEHYMAAGYGEFQPRAPNDIPEGRARNRRITVLFRTADAEPASATVFPPTHVR